MSPLNTRADLEALRGTPDYVEALKLLRGSMVALVNVAAYPEGYVDPGYDGPVIEPVWQEIESLEALDLIGIGREEFLAACQAAGVG